MSYSYASRKKLAKRTKITRLNNQVFVQNQALEKFMMTHQDMLLHLSEFAKEGNWLSDESDFVWNGGGNPVERAKECLARVQGIFKFVPSEQPTPDPTENAKQDSTDKSGDMTPTDTKANVPITV